MTSEWKGNERRSTEYITIYQIENCVYKAIAKAKQEEKVEEIERLRLHQAECPAFQSNKAIKWLIGLPIISTIITLVYYYFLKK